jgi:hypothetical protein
MKFDAVYLRDEVPLAVVERVGVLFVVLWLWPRDLGRIWGLSGQINC